MRTRLHKALLSRVDRAIRDYHLLKPGDRVLVALSGGGDSFSLLRLLDDARYLVGWKADLVPVHIDLGYRQSPTPQIERLEEYLRKRGYHYRIERTDFGPLAHSEYNRANPCFLCARLRRRRLFEIAEEEGCGKIAFGHHKDDVISTFFLNLLYNREISTIMPLQEFFGGKFHVIRPLYYIEKPMLEKFALEQGFPIFGSGCPISGRTERDRLAGLIRQLTLGNPGLRENIFRALYRVKSDYLPRTDGGSTR